MKSKTIVGIALAIFAVLVLSVFAYALIPPDSSLSPIAIVNKSTQSKATGSSASTQVTTTTQSQTSNTISSTQSSFSSPSSSVPVVSSRTTRAS